MLYENIVYRHFENPFNVGSIKNATHHAIMGSPHEGTVIKLTAKIVNNVIEDIAFKAYGGVAMIASMSLLTEKIKGQTIEQALKITSTDLSEELKLEPVKFVYSIMAIAILQKILNK